MMLFLDFSLQKRERIIQLQHLKQHADFVYQAFGGDGFTRNVNAHSWRYDNYTISFDFDKPNKRNNCQAAKVMPLTEAHSWPFSVYSIQFGQQSGEDILWEGGVSAIGISSLPLCFYQYTRIRKPANIDTTKMLRKPPK